MATSRSKPVRFRSLDAMRGFAALVVVWNHYIAEYGHWGSLTSWMEPSPLHFWYDGGASVSLFFVLSGFVLSFGFFRKSQAEKMTDRYLLGYFVKRICRIWLPFIFVFLISYLLLRTCPQIAETIPPRAKDNIEQLTLFNSDDFWREASLVFRSPWGHVLLPQDWTLSTELLLSLLVPFGVAFTRMHPAALIVPVVLYACLKSWGPYYGVHFALGILLAQLMNGPFWKALSRNQWVARAALLVGLSLYVCRYPLGGAEASNYPVWLATWYATAFGSVLLIFWVLRTERAKKLLERPGPLSLGKVSYSLYLCHQLVLIWITPYFLRFLQKVGLVNESACWALGFVFVTAFCLGLSWPLYRFVEVPSMNLGAWLAKRVPGS